MAERTTYSPHRDFCAADSAAGARTQLPALPMRSGQSQSRVNSCEPWVTHLCGIPHHLVAYHCHSAIGEQKGLQAWLYYLIIFLCTGESRFGMRKETMESGDQQFL